MADVIQLTGVVANEAVVLNGVTGAQQIAATGSVAQRGAPGDPAENLVTSVAGKQGIVNLATGDIDGLGSALDGKESIGNKSSSTSLGGSDTLFPTQNAVKTYVDAQVIAGATPDATSSTKGKSALTGDLGGTADAPKTKSRTVSVTVGPVGSTADYVCDGTNDNVEVQAAIDFVNTAGGGTVYMRSGTYDIGATVFIKNNVYIIGEGWNTILKSKNALNTFPLRCYGATLGTPQATTNFMLRDIKFDLNGPNQTSQNSYISLTAPQHFTLDHVYVYNSYGFGILTQASGDPITGIVPDYGLVTNCRFDTQFVTVAGTLRDFAVFNLQHSRIVNNFWGTICSVVSPNYALSAGRTMRDTIVANNVFKETNMTSIGLEDTHDCIVVNNRIQGSSTYPGTHGIFMNNFNSSTLIERNTIAGNMVSLMGVDGIKVGEAAGATDMIIYGNTCYMNGRDGISVYGASLCSIFANKCKNNGQSGSYVTPEGSGIRMSGGSPLNTQIFNNQCVDDQATPTQKWGIYAGNGDYYDFHGNKMAGNSVGTYSIPGSNSKVSHNDTGGNVEAHDSFKITESLAKRALEVYSNQTTMAVDTELVKINVENALFDKKALFVRNDGTDTGTYMEQNGTPVNSFDAALYVNVTHTSANAGVLRTLDASPATSMLLDKNNSGLNIDIDQDVTDANWSNGAFRITATTNATAGGTYTKSGSIASVTSDTSVTSGTITDTAEVLKISQLNTGASGAVLDVDNRGTGKSLVLKSNTTEKFSVAADGTITASNKIVSVTDPTSAQDAATKAYVDAQVSAGTPDADATTKGKLRLTGNLSGTATTPTVTGVSDTNGVNILASIAVASATNYFTMTNANAGSPVFGVAGSDTNIGFQIKSKGTGVIALRPGSNSTSNLSMQDSSGNAILRVDTSNSRVSIGATAAAPTSTLMINGSVSTPIASKTGAYTLVITDNTIKGDATGGAFSLTLPTAVGIDGREYVLKKVDSSINAVTVATTSSQTIDGSTTYSLLTQYKYVRVKSDGANWMVIGGN